MSTFPNPPLIVGPAPADGQSAVYDAATNTWVASGPYAAIETVYIDYHQMDAPATFNDIGSGSYTGSLVTIEDFWGAPQTGLADLTVDTTTPGRIDLPVGLYYLTGRFTVTFADSSQDGKFFYAETECASSDENSGGWIGFCQDTFLFFSFSLITAFLPASPGDLTAAFNPIVPNASGSGDYTTAIASIGGNLTISKLPSLLG